MVKIQNPADKSIGETTEEAFELVWEPRGWSRVDDDVRTTVEQDPSPVGPLDSMRKDELVDIANANALDSSGNKAELIERLRAAGLEG